MSQNFDLIPNFLFMLCTHFGEIFFQLLFTFYVIKIEQRPKLKKMRHFSWEELYKGIPQVSKVNLK